MSAKNKSKPVFTVPIFDFENVDENNENAWKEIERFSQTGDELAGPNYCPKVDLLKTDRYVTRISNANGSSKTLFSGRRTTAMTEKYDLKNIPSGMSMRYVEFCDYVLANK